ncbi:hypothetical protein ACC668_10575 [Rhizobium ruizarguesonis]
MSTDMRDVFVFEHMSRRAPKLFAIACSFIGAAIFSAVTDNIVALRTVASLVAMATAIIFACLASETARQERAAALARWDDLLKNRPPPPGSRTPRTRC